jgi:hypothetical protein
MYFNGRRNIAASLFSIAQILFYMAQRKSEITSSLLGANAVNEKRCDGRF